MTKFQRLRKELLESCKFRGHDMFANSPMWSKNGRTIKQYECKVCGKLATLDTKPDANGIDIGGAALALGCSDKY